MQDTRASFKDANVNHNNGNNDNFRYRDGRYCRNDIWHTDKSYIEPICSFLQLIPKKILQSFFDVEDIDFKKVKIKECSYRYQKY